MRAFKSLVFFLVLCLIVEILGGWLTALSVRDWYPSLIKPPFTPPFLAFWTRLDIVICAYGDCRVARVASASSL